MLLESVVITTGVLSTADDFSATVVAGKLETPVVACWSVRPIAAGSLDKAVTVGGSELPIAAGVFTRPVTTNGLEKAAETSVIVRSVVAGAAETVVVAFGLTSSPASTKGK